MTGERVAIIGTGRVGTAVALGLARTGHRVVGAVDGGSDSASALAGRIAGLRVHADAVPAVRDADLVLVTTGDAEIEPVVTAVALADAWREGQRVVHCSGAVGIAPLRRAELAGARVAACHPAQTIPTGADADTLVGAAWAVTAAPADRGWAHDLVVDLGGDPFDLPEDARTRYHAALVLGSNALGAALAVARDLLLSARVPDPAAVLRPLVDATIDNVLERGAEALTGPVVRGDVGTVERHLASLDTDLPELAVDYRHLQRVVLARVAAGLDPDAAVALRDVLERPAP